MGNWLPWREHAAIQITRCSGYPELVQDYIDEIDRAKTPDDLPDVAPFLNMDVLIQCAILDIAPGDFPRTLCQLTGIDDNVD